MSLYKVIITLSSISIVLLGILLSFHLGVIEWVKRAAPYYRKKPKRHDVALIWTISCLFVLNVTGVTYASLWHGTKFYSRYDGLIFCDIFSRVQAFASIGVMCGVTAVLRNLYELIRLRAHLYREFQETCLERVSRGFKHLRCLPNHSKSIALPCSSPAIYYCRKYWMQSPAF